MKVRTTEVFINNIKKLHKDNIINGHNFAKKANLVYAETNSRDFFGNIDKNNIHYYKKNIDNSITYSIKNFVLFENDIIFCKTDFLFELFSKLKDVKNLKNIKLITHQSALPSIDARLYKLKPKCISEWYSINLATSKKSLFSIPLGLGNPFSNVTLKIEYFIKYYKTFISESPKNLIYANFRNYSNYEREEMYSILIKNPNFFYEEPNLSLKMYFNKLLEYQYIFSPKGLGIDTHRFWESLYLARVPVAKFNTNYREFEDYFIPYQKIEDINKNNFKEIIFDDKLAKLLNIDFWFDKISKNKIISDNCYTFVTTKKNYINELKLKRKYTRYKILKSNLSFKAKIHFFYRVIKEIHVNNYNQKFFERFWYS